MEEKITDLTFEILGMISQISINIFPRSEYIKSLDSNYIKNEFNRIIGEEKMGSDPTKSYTTSFINKKIFEHKAQKDILNLLESLEIQYKSLDVNTWGYKFEIIGNNLEDLYNKINIYGIQTSYEKDEEDHVKNSDPHQIGYRLSDGGFIVYNIYWSEKLGFFRYY